MAEIEYFVNPDRKQHFDKFSLVADLSVTLFSADCQLEGKPPLKTTLRDAVTSVSSAN